MMGRARRIGLLGGSFNPAHAGHLHISREALKRLKLDEIWWLVSPQNPLKKASELAEYDLRFSFAQATVRDPRIRVLDVESRHGLYYTIDTLKHLLAAHPDCQFVWLMGADNLQHFHRWRAWRTIAAWVPVAVLDRAPYGLRALHGVFARVFARARIAPQHAPQLAAMAAPAWVYLSIPRHPASATELRKTLGSDAFMRHNDGN